MREEADVHDVSQADELIEEWKQLAAELEQRK